MITWLVAMMLWSVRLGVAIGASPPLASYGLPLPVRMALVVAMATMLAAPSASSPSTVMHLVDEPTRLIEAIGAEVVIGMLLGLGVHVALAAFAVAGRMLDVQVGFGIGSIFDPLTRASSNALASLMSLLGVVLFFVTDAHLALASLVSFSTLDLPLGTLPTFDDPMRMLFAAGTMFSTGLALAAPVLLALLATDALIGVASRNLPQINVLVLSIPVKVLVGYVVLALTVTAWAPVVNTLFGQTIDLVKARR
jgi:flagellar biosynthesis protein FliR